MMGRSPSTGDITEFVSAGIRHGALERRSPTTNRVTLVHWILVGRYSTDYVSRRVSRRGSL